MKRYIPLLLLLAPMAYCLTYDSGGFAIAPADSILVSSFSVTNTINASTVTASSNMVTSTMTVTNLITASSATFSNSTVSGSLLLGTGFRPAFNAAPRTNVTPAFVGMLIFNSTQNELCISSGTTASTWVKVISTTTACAS